MGQLRNLPDASYAGNGAGVEKTTSSQEFSGKVEEARRRLADNRTAGEATVVLDENNDGVAEKRAEISAYGLKLDGTNSTRLKSQFRVNTNTVEYGPEGATVAHERHIYSAFRGSDRVTLSIAQAEGHVGPNNRIVYEEPDEQPARTIGEGTTEPEKLENPEQVEPVESVEERSGQSGGGAQSSEQEPEQTVEVKPAETSGNNAGQGSRTTSTLEVTVNAGMLYTGNGNETTLNPVLNKSNPTRLNANFSKPLEGTDLTLGAQLLVDPRINISDDPKGGQSELELPLFDANLSLSGDLGQGLPNWKLKLGRITSSNFDARGFDHAGVRDAGGSPQNSVFVGGGRPVGDSGKTLAQAASSGDGGVTDGVGLYLNQTLPNNGQLQFATVMGRSLGLEDSSNLNATLRYTQPLGENFELKAAASTEQITSPELDIDRSTLSASLLHRPTGLHAGASFGTVDNARLVEGVTSGSGVDSYQLQAGWKFGLTPRLGDTAITAAYGNYSHSDGDTLKRFQLYLVQDLTPNLAVYAGVTHNDLDSASGKDGHLNTGILGARYKTTF